jgi:thiol-disulfide isomerase/thioredoxin
MKRPGPRTKRIVAAVVVLGLVQLLAVLVYRAVEQRRATAKSPGFRAEPLNALPAPDVELLRPGGTTFRLSELRGRPVLVHFWATWCKPCVDELPELLALTREPEQSGRFVLVAIAADERWDTVLDFFGGEIPVEVVRGAHGDEHKRFGVSTFPDSYLVRSSGEISFRFPGAQTWRAEAARRFLIAAQKEYL